jgi:amino acid permease
MEDVDAAASAAANPDSTIVIEELPSRASPSQAVSLLVNAAVGAGVLSLPFAFRCAGYIGGPLILAIVAITESFTLYVLSKWAEKTNAASYGEVVLRSAGTAAATALSFIIFFYLFGSGVAYLVILGDCFHPLLSRVLGATWYTTKKAAIVSVGTAVVLPMCFAESVSASANISGVNFVAFLLVIVALIGRSAETLAAADERRFVGVKAFAPTWAAAVPIAAFGLQCHAQVVAVFNELREYSSDIDTNNGEGEHENQIESSSSLLARIRIGDPLLINRKSRRSLKLVAMTKIIITASEYTRKF